ncbi:Yip1 family protein [Peribacillus frigoritolerans]|uniref:Yip1 family protein n=1 Tax=Peribacillus frigoritolerans TaxID=450367 RepID=UPI00105A3D17|nr:Yip1 family protein [Peribacillus frigoritolerans]TDL80089.1 YIP1 family protein [Peribacillus frigoritolerans]
MEQQTNPAVEGNSPEPPKPSLFGMIMNPGEQFDRIRQKPKVLVGFLLVTLMVLIGTFLSFVNAPELTGDLTSEEAAMVGTIMGAVSIVVGGIGSIIVLIIMAAITLAFTKMVGSAVKFKQILSMTIYIAFVTSIGTLLNGLIAFLVKEENYINPYTSLNSIVGAEGGLGGLLMTFEVFTIWGTVLTAIGLQRVAGLSKAAAWTIAIIFFVIGAVLAAAGGVLEGMFPAA